MAAQKQVRTALALPVILRPTAWPYTTFPSLPSVHKPLFGCEVHCSSWISLVPNTQGTKYHQWSIQIRHWGLCPLTWWSAAENVGLQESVKYMALGGCVQWWGTLYGYQLEGNFKKVGMESVSWHKADTNWEWRSEVLIYHYDPIWTCMYAKLIFETEKYQQCMATHAIKWPERLIPAWHVHGCHMWVVWLQHASLQLYIHTAILHILQSWTVAPTQPCTHLRCPVSSCTHRQVLLLMLLWLTAQRGPVHRRIKICEGYFEGLPGIAATQERRGTSTACWQTNENVTSCMWRGRAIEVMAEWMIDQWHTNNSVHTRASYSCFSTRVPPLKAIKEKYILHR